MSEQPENPVPPAGDDIHLPGGSVQPILLTLGVTIALVGLTTDYWILAVGLILTVGTLVAWIRDTIRETNALPLHHHDEH
ncbi:cytochrome c oxidase subunit 4 [Patulibacter sp. SYSU D01012]|uniref:cytochrome c oxidase subunit 4 n=1 Tax=Patulibacter sp. SYSU D01012 TaxID=2817381 RepID=UPI001B3146C6|nr:cytochrome c oxidase subunit 4 [Patulibacter sp. SYSU D01012]